MNEKPAIDNEAGPGAAADKKNVGAGKPLMIVILVGVVLLNSAIAFVLIKATTPKSEAQMAAEAQADSIREASLRGTSMGATTAEAPIEVIVNIAGTEGERFLKAAVIFEYDDKAFPKLGEELVKRAPRFKDLLINHLSRLTLEEVNEPEAKDHIRKDLLRLVNATLPPEYGEVRDVLFTSYIVQ